MQTGTWEIMKAARKTGIERRLADCEWALRVIHAWASFASGRMLRVHDVKVLCEWALKRTR